MKKLRITFNSPVVLAFAFICLIATILGTVSGGSITNDFFVTYRSPLTNPLTYLRAISHVFGHAGWEHLISNMSFILLLGPILEEKYGSEKIVGVIALTAISTAVINAVISPNAGVCGASGVVFAFIILSSFTNFKEGEIPLTFILVAAIYIGQQVIEGIFVQDNISQMAHIIGGAVGAYVGYVWNKRR
ncbi:MAG: rhomboid family intramembrane serine protease [Lachnospiraceae bacterium]|nr:rhomboid family intramembrane serine protease [Lachnospiraceae bacterium]